MKFITPKRDAIQDKSMLTLHNSKNLTEKFNWYWLIGQGR